MIVIRIKILREILVAVVTLVYLQARMVKAVVGNQKIKCLSPVAGSKPQD